MRIFILTLAISFILPALSNASDAELEEKLKAVMILFDKSQQGLKEEIASLQLQVTYLEEQNVKLSQDLDAERRKNLDLKTQILVQQSRAQDTDSSGDVVATELAKNELAELNQQANSPRAGQRRGQGGAGRQNAQLPPPSGDLLNINEATKDQLLALPLVNDFLADNIIDGRPWGSVEDLIQLQGFGPMKLRRLQPYVTTEPISELTEETVSENPLN